MENDVHLQSLPPNVLLGSQKGAPLTAPAKRDTPFMEPSNYLLKFPVNRLQFPQWAPTERDAHLQSFLLHLSLKVPGKWAPPPCSPTGSLWREKKLLQSQWFIPSFISVTRALQWQMGKTFGHRPRTPRGWKAYMQRVAAWYPRM
jgi:hypothetical protein